MLSIPLIADNNRVRAYIFINKNNFTVNLEFTDRKSTHTFDDENSMFSYLHNIGLQPEDFKLAPF